MEHKSSLSRTFTSIFLSLLFHSSLVALGAVLGVFFMQMSKVPQKVVITPRGEHKISVETVASPAPPLAVEPLVAAELKATPAVAALPTLKTKPVQTAKKTQKAKKITDVDFTATSPAETLPAQVSPAVETQEVIEVNETLNEPASELASSDDQIREEVSSTPLAATSEEIVYSSESSAADDSLGAPSSLNSDLSAQAASELQNFTELRQAPGNKPPIYPESARLNNIQGRGQLKYFVTRDGRVKDVMVVQSTGHSELDQAALSAVKDYKFIPGQEGYTLHNFEFNLQGLAEPMPRRLRTSSTN